MVAVPVMEVRALARTWRHSMVGDTEGRIRHRLLKEEAMALITEHNQLDNTRYVIFMTRNNMSNALASLLISPETRSDAGLLSVELFSRPSFVLPQYNPYDDCLAAFGTSVLSIPVNRSHHVVLSFRQ